MEALTHLTLTSGHARTSPRSEVTDDVIRMLAPIVGAGGGEIHGLRLALERGGDPALFSLGWGEGAPAVRCVLSASGSPVAWDAALRIARDSGVVRDLAEPPPPWLAIAVLPAALALDPERLAMLGEAERCVAWAILEGAAR